MQNNKIKKCRVCGDHSSVFYNYNGLSCKSCKKFFLRTITKNMDYFCVFDENCPIDMHTRKQCQKCRLTKCLEIGMKKELAILNKLNSEILHKSSKILKPKAPTSELNSYEMSHITVVQAAAEKLDFTQNVQVAGSITTLLETINCHEYFVRRFVKFCKCIPAFKELNSADQLILLKEAYPEVCNINTAFYIDYENQRMPIVGDESGDRIYYLDCAGISAGLNQNSSLPWQDFNEFTRKLKCKINNDIMIKNLLIVQVLFQTRDNISSPEFIRYNHILYQHLLKLYLQYRYQNKTSTYASTIYKSIQKQLSQLGRYTVFFNQMMQLEIADVKQVNDILKEIFITLM